MSLGGDDGSKHDMNPTMSGSGNHTPPSKSFTINNARNTICINSLPTMLVAIFTCYGTSIGKIRKSGFGLGLPEVVLRDTGKVLRKTLPHTRGRRHESSFHAITQVSRVLRVKAVSMISIDEGIEEAQNHKSILNVSHEHTGDQITYIKFLCGNMVGLSL